MKLEAAYWACVWRWCGCRVRGGVWRVVCTSSYACRVSVVRSPFDRAGSLVLSTARNRVVRLTRRACVMCAAVTVTFELDSDQVSAQNSAELDAWCFCLGAQTSSRTDSPRRSSKPGAQFPCDTHCRRRPHTARAATQASAQLNLGCCVCSSAHNRRSSQESERLNQACTAAAWLPSLSSMQDHLARL